MKGDLFSLKTDKGYGLFQEFDYAEEFFGMYYCVYYTQIKSLSNINEALNGDYYLTRLRHIRDVFDKDILKLLLVDNKGIEIDLNDMADKIMGPCRIKDYNDCYVTYLGNYALPVGLKLPRFTRVVAFNYISGNYSWILNCELDNRGDYSEEEKRLIWNYEKNKLMIYKTLTKEIEDFPNRTPDTVNRLLEKFNFGYDHHKGDLWVAREFEKYYEEHPELLPTDEKYDDVKYPLPSENFREMLTEKDGTYLAFCDKLDVAFKTFIYTIDQNRRSVKAPLVRLIKDLNAIDKETELIGSLEAEEINFYLVKILRTLKKASLIDTLDNLCEW